MVIKKSIAVVFLILLLFMMLATEYNAEKNKNDKNKESVVSKALETKQGRTELARSLVTTNTLVSKKK